MIVLNGVLLLKLSFFGFERVVGGSNMDVMTVSDLLRVIEDDDRVCIDLPGSSSGVGFVRDFRRNLSAEFLGARVTCVWRSLYNKIVIEAEV